jgi:hypothetical protein
MGFNNATRKAKNKFEILGQLLIKKIEMTTNTIEQIKTMCMEHSKEMLELLSQLAKDGTPEEVPERLPEEVPERLPEEPQVESVKKSEPDPESSDSDDDLPISELYKRRRKDNKEPKVPVVRNDNEFANSKILKAKVSRGGKLISGKRIFIHLILDLYGSLPQDTVIRYSTFAVKRSVNESDRAFKQRPQIDGLWMQNQSATSCVRALEHMCRMTNTDYDITIRKFSGEIVRLTN